MKKMISCLAVLAMLAAAPTAAVFAADKTPASVSEEAAYDETDIRNLAGQWKYQVAPEGMNITAGAIDNGIITVKEDGTYTYTDLDGKTHTGTVKVDYDTFGGEYKVPFFAFYEGDEFFIGCYCQQNNPNAYIVGNGGIAQLLSVDADFSAIEGEWDTADIDGRVFNISANGMYTVTYPDNSTEQGFIRIGNELFSENNDGTWYNFYNESGIAWIGFPKTDIEPVNELKAGEFTLRRRNTDPRNDYGFYTPAEYPVTSVSTAALIGTWKEAENDNAVLTITEGRSLYNSRFEYVSETETVRGIINLEYTLTQSNDREYWYTFYNIDGTFWNGFGVSGEIPLNDIYSGQDGAMHFVRQQDEKTADKNESASFDKEDKTKGAIRVMENFNVIMALTGASPAYTTDDGKVKDYVKVTDSRFTSIADLYAFVADNFTGEAKEVFIRYIDGYFIENDGSLYVQSIPRSFYQFHTEDGVTITDPAMDYCTATANKGDQLYGFGRAVLRCESGKWHIESYEFGDFYGTERHDVSEIAGTWDEVDTLYPRNLVIRNDGSFTLIFINGRAMYGTVKVEDIGYPNGSIQTWFNLYDENDEFYTGFEATSQTPLNDLYTGQDGSEHFVRYIEPEHKYSTDELQEMAAKDYEEKTGIRPASTHSMTNAGGSVTVVFTDEKGEDFDAYTVDPDTGVGEKFSDGSVVNLPQTGVNSLALAGTLAGASAITLMGIGAVICSGKLRRKEDEE